MRRSVRSKVRARGASAGELVVGLAQAQLAVPATGQVWTRSAPIRSLPKISAVPFQLPRPLPGGPAVHPPSIAGIEARIAGDRSARGRVCCPRSAGGAGQAVTMDMDSTDVECSAQISGA